MWDLQQGAAATAIDAKCAELGWVCVPVVSETYGAWGTEAIDFSHMPCYDFGNTQII